MYMRANTKTISIYQRKTVKLFFIPKSTNVHPQPHHNKDVIKIRKEQQN